MKQYYSLSNSILAEIKRANRILINAHRNPDLDSLGSATALYQALIRMGKKTALICSHLIPENFKFLKDADKVMTVDFSSFDFSSYDLFLIADSGSYDVVTGSKEIKLPDVKKIVIDHHKTNNFTDVYLRLLDEKASSTAEIVYNLFSDWNFEIDKDISTSLFSGIAGDTVFFKYGKSAQLTFKIASELLDLGADKNRLVDQVFDSFDFDLVRTMGEFLIKMKKENSPTGEFIYSIMDYKTFVRFGKQSGARETVANLFARSIKGCDFGIMAVEYEKEKFAISFRSKSDTDVSVIAKRLGGGGHKNAAGATVNGEYSECLKKILEAVK